MKGSRTAYRVRPYADTDEAEVLRLLDEVLVVSPAGGPPSRLFRWKHLENPFGRSHLLVADAGGRIVGLRAFMRWTFRAGGRAYRAVRAVDTATHPEFQGRGVFSRLTLAALEDLRGDADFVFNTPNARSGPGYLKMGWRAVGRLPVQVRVRRPLRFLRGLPAIGAAAPAGGPRPPVIAASAAEALEDGALLAEVLEARGPDRGGLSTPHSPEYLRWRYAGGAIDYRAVWDPGERGARGLAIFRIRQRGRLWEAAVSEVLVAPGDGGTAARLLRRVAAAAPTDHLLCLIPRGSFPTGATRRTGFLPWRHGPVLMVNSLREALVPDPVDPRSWSLSLGDVEVF
ncbi:MAG: GNAT family N-acetyltransferase [Actinomycetota bacterium]